MPALPELFLGLVSTLSLFPLFSYVELCKKVLEIAKSSQMSKHPIIQTSLLVLLPRIAAFKKDLFTQNFLTETVQFMDRLLQDRLEYSFVAIGLLAVAVGKNLSVQGFFQAFSRFNVF